MSEHEARRVAVVCVHGVAPHPRYEFQDQVAGQLRDELCAQDGGEWVIDVVNPGNVLDHGADEPLPTISRVHRGDDDDADAPQGAYFDVMEAYWSPYTKGQTNWFSVLQWILRIVFVPLNTTARYHATWQKQLFDYGYIGATLLIAFGLFFLSLTAAWQSLLRIIAVTGIFRTSSADGVITALNANANAPGGVPVKIVVWLFVGIVGAFLVGQGLAAIWKLIAQRKALRASPNAVVHRVIAIAVLLLLGSGAIYAMATVHFPRGDLGWAGVTFLVLVFVAFQLGYALLIWFIVGFFGDIQVYTTRDENDSRFYAARDTVLDKTVTAILRSISPQLNGGHRYDRVIVVAHSLGATIAMDALVRLYQLALQGSVQPEEFARLRAFVTFGSSLEKTRYFFDVQGVDPSASFEAWRNDVSGLIFTRDPRVLAGPNGHGIFWANYWYFQDPFCNEIRSFRSFLHPGEPFQAARALRVKRSDDPDYDSGRGRVVCWNERGTKRISLAHLMLHSDYLFDPWFWHSSKAGRRPHIGVLDILTNGVEIPGSKSADALAQPALVLGSNPVPERVDRVDA